MESDYNQTQMDTTNEWSGCSANPSYSKQGPKLQGYFRNSNTVPPLGTKDTTSIGPFLSLICINIPLFHNPIFCQLAVAENLPQQHHPPNVLLLKQKTAKAGAAAATFTAATFTAAFSEPILWTSVDVEHLSFSVVGSPVIILCLITLTPSLRRLRNVDKSVTILHQFYFAFLHASIRSHIAGTHRVFQLIHMTD